MPRMHDSARRWAVMALIASACIVGCTVEPRRAPPLVDAGPSRPQGVLSAEEAERARARIAVGKSSKAEVVSALGKASAIVLFESGFEVWVYRIRPPQQANQGDTEFVMLFAPSGILTKTRLRSSAPVG